MSAHKLPGRHILWARYGFQNLLVWLLVYMMIGPFLDPVPFADTLLGVLLTFVLLSAIWTLDRDNRLVSVGVILMVLALVLMWSSKLHWVNLSPVFSHSLLAVYYGVLIHSFLRHIVAVKRVNVDVICAALCLYLIIGLLWGTFFQLLEICIPNSFAGGILDSAANPEDRTHVLNYLSFVTLSTLGYGDVTPQTQAAAALCQTEAILGQFFTVVLVARLVGIQVAQQVNEES